MGGTYRLILTSRALAAFPHGAMDVGISGAGVRDVTLGVGNNGVVVFSVLTSGRASCRCVYPKLSSLEAGG